MDRTPEAWSFLMTTKEYREDPSETEQCTGGWTEPYSPDANTHDMIT